MNTNTKNALIAILILIVLGVGYKVMTTPEHRTVGEKVDAAVEQLDNGVDNAARELKDRTPAERASDAVKDATDSE